MTADKSFSQPFPNRPAPECLAAREWLAILDCLANSTPHSGEASVVEVEAADLQETAKVLPEELSIREREQLAQARQHTARCPDCQLWLSDQRRFDRQVGELLRATPVPVEGPERLLRQLRLRERALRLAPLPQTAVLPVDTGVRSRADASLPSDAPQSSLVGGGVPVEPSGLPVLRASEPLGPGAGASVLPPSNSATGGPTSGNGRRRRRQVAVAAVVALLLCTLGWWIWTPPQVGGAEVFARLAQLDWRAPALRPFAGWASRVAPRLPAEMETAQIQSAPWELPVERVEVAVFFFESRRPGAKQVQAALAILPVEHLLGGHRLGGFLSTPPETAAGLTATTWVEGRLAFVCCVRGTNSDLMRLARPKPAA